MKSQATHLVPKSAMHRLSVATAQLVRAMHAPHTALPETVVNVFKGHWLHVVTPTVPEYVPGEHSWQTLRPLLGP